MESIEVKEKGKTNKHKSWKKQNKESNKNLKAINREC
jgi:hypothetical protein